VHLVGFCYKNNQIFRQFIALHTKCPQSVRHSRYQRDTDLVTEAFPVRYEQFDGAIVFGLATSKNQNLT